LTPVGTPKILSSHGWQQMQTWMTTQTKQKLQDMHWQLSIIQLTDQPPGISPFGKWLAN
jgi:hypothetical protein